MSRVVEPNPLVAGVVGIDGCGKSSTYRGALELLSRRHHAVGIGDDVLEGRPGGKLQVRTDIPLSRSARAIGRFAKARRTKWVYKNLKFLELNERSHIRRYVSRTESPDLVLTDGCPLVNSAAWCVARYFPDELASDEVLLRSCQYLAGKRRIPLAELGFYLGRAWQLVFVNWLGIGRFPPPDHVFLLDLDPAVAMERIRARGKPLQVHENEAFLGALRQSYERVCRLLPTEFPLAVSTIPVDEVPLEEAVATVADELEDILEQRGRATR